MAGSSRVLVVAHQTACTQPLLDAIRARAERGPAKFHLVVPRQPHGMDKVANPQDAGQAEARHVLADALPKLSDVAGTQVTGSVGDHEPLMAVEDALNQTGPYDEIIISTLAPGISRWLRLDLVSKVRAEGLPVTHVVPQS